VAAVLPIRMLAQRVVEVGAGFGLRETLDVARGERPDLTTPQPKTVPAPAAAPPVGTSAIR
jgi:hypothetical protein